MDSLEKSNIILSELNFKIAVPHNSCSYLEPNGC